MTEVNLLNLQLIIYTSSPRHWSGWSWVLWLLNSTFQLAVHYIILATFYGRKIPHWLLIAPPITLRVTQILHLVCS